MAADRDAGVRGEGGERGDGLRWSCLNAADARRRPCADPDTLYQRHDSARRSTIASLIPLSADRAIRVVQRDHLSRSLSLMDPRSGAVVAQIGQASEADHDSRHTSSVLTSPRLPTLRLSADRSLALHTAQRGVLRVWETRTGRHLLSLVPAHGGRFVDAAFSPDNRRIVTLSDVGWIEHWRADGVDVRGLVAEHLPQTNLRVFRSDFRVVVVPPPLDAATQRSPWAPSRACRTAR